MPVICGLCGKTYSNTSSLNRHPCKKSKENSSVSCEICGASFARRDALLRHMKSKHADHVVAQEPVEENAKFKCSICDAAYTMRKSLLRHFRQNHPEDILNEAEAEDDMALGDEEDAKKSKLACPHCSKTYSKQSNLNRHVKGEHPESYVASHETIECPKCDVKCTRMFVLTEHLEKQHDYQDDKKELLFSSMDGFKKWKEEMEQETLSSFVQPRGTFAVRDGTRIDYICHRSGVFTERGTQGRHFHLQTRKCGSVCPARLSVTLCTDQSVKVVWHQNHFAHEVGIRFLRLTESERATIRAQVFEGRSFDRIMDDVRESALEQGRFSRLSVLQRRDLWNIMRGYVFNTKRAHSNDYLSVEAIVQALKEKKHNPILYYKPQDRPCDCGVSNCPLKPEDFMLVLSTPWQREVFKEYASTQVLIDSTHGTNGYDFQLTTLMSVDECGVGVPLAFCLSNHVNAEHMTKFFDVIKENVGLIVTKIFMSDMATTYYNAWERVMTPVEHRLFCSWHLHRAWKKNAVEKVKGFEKQVEAYRAVCVLMELMDIELLHVCLEGLLIMFEEDEDMKEFGEYFRDHYYRNPETWAYCYRLGLGLNTNMFLEAMHKKLKYSYMHGKQLRRVDECIDILLRYARDISIEQVTRIVKGNHSKRNRNIINSHKRSVEEFTEAMVCEENETTWKVQSVSRPGESHMVTVNSDDHCLGCQLACMRCRICIHSYNCTCEDHLKRNNMCKHIHTVARFSTSARCDFSEANVCRQIDEHIETICETAPEVAHAAEAVQPLHVWDTVKTNLQFLMDNCSGTWDRTCLDISVNLIDALQKRLPANVDRSQLAPCTPVKLQQWSQGIENIRTPDTVPRMAPGATPLTPHNIRVTPQRTPRKPGFHSTKTVAAKRSLTLGKPDEAESQNILQTLLSNGQQGA